LKGTFVLQIVQNKSARKRFGKGGWGLGREEMTFPEKVFPPAPTPFTLFTSLYREQG